MTAPMYDEHEQQQPDPEWDAFSEWADDHPEARGMEPFAWDDAPVEPDTRCPACLGTEERALPWHDDIDLHPCPVCRPWPRGFPGEKVGEHFIIPPYGPGETPAWVGWPKREETP